MEIGSSGPPSFGSRLGDVSRVPVLGALEPAEYGPQGLVAGRLVLLDGGGLAGYLGHLGRQAGAPLDGEDAPGEDAVGFFEGGVRAAPFQQLFEGGVELLGGPQGEVEGDGLSVGRGQRIFSR